eukprot:TRINITY_DN4594_c0_g1_i7.p1 TRINITY_DN4594_c0_g1~~TRINITY_DN4594_c0_g1_i7.p1  ORF type:complete len:153 (+),score=42.61 TRINITY_DN4594_c0_g1_i7:66-524(+)
MCIRDRLRGELDKLRNAPSQVQTKVIYQSPTVVPQEKGVAEVKEELSRVKQSFRLAQLELEKKDQTIQELISEKLKTNLQPERRNNQDQERISRLEAELAALKREYDEATKGALGLKKVDSDSMQTIRELSTQNAQLRRKIDDLQTKLAAKK